MHPTNQPHLSERQAAKLGESNLHESRDACGDGPSGCTQGKQHGQPGQPLGAGDHEDAPSEERVNKEAHDSLSGYLQLRGTPKDVVNLRRTRDLNDGDVVRIGIRSSRGGRRTHGKVCGVALACASMFRKDGLTWTVLCESHFAVFALRILR
jgi:hypothetical protein